MVQAAIPDHRTRHLSHVFDWLTVEHAGYMLAVLVALGVRLWGLGATALSPAEATQALPAVAAANGAVPDLSGVSPFLYALQRIIFGLFGASDESARFWPALIGGLSPALFFLLRNYLTRGGALAAALLWSLSPLGVWSSRLSLGDALVPALALALFAVIAAANRARSWSVAFGLAVGLLLISGPNAYTVLLGAVTAALWWAGEARAFWSHIRSQYRFILVGLFVALLVATFFLTEPAGLAAAAELLGQWVSDLIPGRGEYSMAEILVRLLLSELFAVGFGLAGLIWSLRHGERMGSWLGIATALALAVALIGRGRDPIDLSLVALGLALLAGPAVARALTHFYEWRHERDLWLLVLVPLALLSAAALGIAGGFNAANTEDWRSLYVGVGIATLIMSLVIWVAYGVWENWGAVIRAFPAVALILGLAWQVSSLVALSFDHAAWRQPAIVHQAPAADLIDLQGELQDLSALVGGSAREANVDVVWPQLGSDPMVPMLRWQLRDLPYARFSAAVPPDVAPLVLTPVEDQPRLDGYSGAEFAVLQRWTTAQLTDFASTVRWILYREALTPPEKTRLILWVDKAEN